MTPSTTFPQTESSSFVKVTSENLLSVPAGDVNGCQNECRVGSSKGEDIGAVCAIENTFLFISSKCYFLLTLVTRVIGLSMSRFFSQMVQTHWIHWGMLMDSILILYGEQEIQPLYDGYSTVFWLDPSPYVNLHNHDSISTLCKWVCPAQPPSSQQSHQTVKAGGQCW